MTTLHGSIAKLAIVQSQHFAMLMDIERVEYPLAKKDKPVFLLPVRLGFSGDTVLPGVAVFFCRPLSQKTLPDPAA